MNIILIGVLHYTPFAYQQKSSQCNKVESFLFLYLKGENQEFVG